MEVSFSGFHALHLNCVDIAERMFFDQDVIGVLAADCVDPFGSAAFIIVQFGLHYFFEDFPLPFDDPVEVVVLGVVIGAAVVDEAVGGVGAVAVLAVLMAVAVVALLSGLGQLLYFQFLNGAGGMFGQAGQFLSIALGF